jgi:5-formyltetrahydrofolate cyclo-ligase
VSYFVGFIDGDGIFLFKNKQIKLQKKKQDRLCLASNVNSLLEKFQKELRVGTISKMSSLNGTRDQVRIIFYRRDLINVIIPLMKEYDLKFLTYQRGEAPV